MTETCPSCSSKNYVYTPDMDGDMTKLDTTDYTCWSCKKEIRIVSGEFHDEIRPHVMGEEPWDEFMAEGHEQGYATASEADA